MSRARRDQVITMIRMSPSEKLTFAPEALFSLWQPTNTVSWAAKGILHFIVMMTWLLTVVWWAGPLLMTVEHVVGSYRAFKRRQRRRH